MVLILEMKHPFSVQFHLFKINKMDEQQVLSKKLESFKVTGKWIYNLKYLSV